MIFNKLIKTRKPEPFYATRKTGKLKKMPSCFLVQLSLKVFRVLMNILIRTPISIISILMIFTSTNNYDKDPALHLLSLCPFAGAGVRGCVCQCGAALPAGGCICWCGAAFAGAGCAFAGAGVSLYLFFFLISEIFSSFPLDPPLPP